MPASLYRLVNRPHHSEPTATPEQKVEQRVEQNVDESLSNQSDTASVIAIEDESQKIETPVVQSDSSDASPKPATQSWDPTWAKTKLFDFAIQLGLNVTPISTKAEIVSALTAATSK